jgi:hypothetical protein
MSELRFIFRILSLLRTITTLFIRSTPNCGFVRMNHQRRIILKRLFKLCSLLIGSYNINIGPKTTNTMLTSFVTYSRLRSMMNLLLRIITNIVFEAHFTISTNSMFEADCSSKDHQNPSTDEPTLNVDDYMDSDNTMVEYNLNR